MKQPEVECIEITYVNAQLIADAREYLHRKAGAIKAGIDSPTPTDVLAYIVLANSNLLEDPEDEKH